MAHALRLLQERGDRHAAFWACPPCDAAFPSSVEFNEHLYAYHEEAVYADEASGRYLLCSRCSQEARPPPIVPIPTPVPGPLRPALFLATLSSRLHGAALPAGGCCSAPA